MKKAKLKYKLLPSERFTPPVAGWGPQEFNRIQALINIPRFNVKRGDIGGYVTSRNILSQEGDCWIADDAIVYGRVKVKDNAYIAKNAQIIAGADKVSINIQDNVIITDNAKIYRTNDGGNWHSFIQGMTRIRDNAKLNDPRYVKDSITVRGNAIILEADISGVSEISGSAKILSGCVISNSTISDNAVVFKNANLSHVTVCDDARIDSDQTFSQQVLDGSGLYRNPPKKTPIIIVDGDTRKVVEESQEDLVQPDPSGESAENDNLSDETKLLNEIIANIKAYETDIVKIIRYPIMTDRTDSYTLAMVMALKKAHRLSNGDSEKFADAINDLEAKFLSAESNAVKIAATQLSDEELKKIVKAQDLFNMAGDEAAGEHERKSAFIQGFKQLQGVITVPEAAIDTFRAKLGFKELTVS